MCETKSEILSGIRIGVFVFMFGVFIGFGLTFMFSSYCVKIPGSNNRLTEGEKVVTVTETFEPVKIITETRTLFVNE